MRRGRIRKYSQVGAWVTARESSEGSRDGWVGEDNHEFIF